MTLHAEISGDLTAGPAMILIHGFGGSAAAWDRVRGLLPAEMPIIAYDLPGHRYSVLAEGRGGAGRMAKAVLSDLETRGFSAFHLAGHSMGGAVAALAAMRAGDKVKSLTLFAPGGMGPEIDAAGLEAFAQAKTVEAVQSEMRKMVAEGFEIPRDMIDSVVKERAMPGVMEALLEVYGAMFASVGAMEQGVIPRDMLAALAMPASVYWGDADPTLPVRQMAQIPDNFRKIIIPGSGHMLLDECPQVVADGLIAAYRQ